MGDYAGQENIVEETQGQSGGDQNGTGTPGINPAWNDALSVLPQEFHSQVTPHFQKWDQNFQNKIQEVHSQYEPYKQYEPFIQAQVTPDELNYAYGLYNALNTNPAEFLQALQEAVGGEQVQPEQQGQNELTPQSAQEYPDIQDHPYVQRLNGMVETMAQIFLGQQEEAQQAESDQEFEQELEAAKETHGDYDERYVVGVLMANPEMSVDDAVKQYKQIEQSILAGKRQPGPPVLSGGGNIPSGNPSLNGLSPKDRRAAVANMLAQAAQQT